MLIQTIKPLRILRRNIEEQGNLTASCSKITVIVPLVYYNEIIIIFYMMMKQEKNNDYLENYIFQNKV